MEGWKCCLRQLPSSLEPRNRWRRRNVPRMAELWWLQRAASQSRNVAWTAAPENQRGSPCHQNQMVQRYRCAGALSAGPLLRRFRSGASSAFQATTVTVLCVLQRKPNPTRESLEMPGVRLNIVFHTKALSLRCRGFM